MQHGPGFTDMLKRREQNAERIAALEAALHAINRINDHPGRFSKEIQDVLDSVIDTSDVKFDRG